MASVVLFAFAMTTVSAIGWMRSAIRSDRQRLALESIAQCSLNKCEACREIAKDRWYRG